jgi:hypothetical protein
MKNIQRMGSKSGSVSALNYKVWHLGLFLSEKCVEVDCPIAQTCKIFYLPIFAEY